MSLIPWPPAALICSLSELGGVLQKVLLRVGEHGADVHRGIHHCVRHLVRKNGIVIERRVAAVRQVRRLEVRHVDMQRDVGAPAVSRNLCRHHRERAARAVGESCEIDAEGVAVRLDAVILLDEIFGRG